MWDVFFISSLTATFIFCSIYISCVCHRALRLHLSGQSSIVKVNLTNEI